MQFRCLPFTPKLRTIATVKNTPDPKIRLHEACLADVERRIATLEDVLAGIAAARENETKSSVGDKYETGRAMLQRQEAQARAQLGQVLEQRRELDALDFRAVHERVRKGSLVTTTRGNYYLAIGLGKITVDGLTYFCISTQSPIGRAMLHRETGDRIHFNGIDQVITGIA